MPCKLWILLPALLFFVPRGFDGLPAATTSQEQIGQLVEDLTAEPAFHEYLDLLLHYEAFMDRDRVRGQVWSPRKGAGTDVSISTLRDLLVDQGYSALEFDADARRVTDLQHLIARKYTPELKAIFSSPSEQEVFMEKMAGEFIRYRQEAKLAFTVPDCVQQYCSATVPVCSEQGECMSLVGLCGRYESCVGTAFPNAWKLFLGTVITGAVTGAGVGFWGGAGVGLLPATVVGGLTGGVAGGIGSVVYYAAAMEECDSRFSELCRQCAASCDD